MIARRWVAPLTWLFTWLFVVCAAAARAQTLPSGPISIDEVRLVIGGDISATIGSTDPGFFNYTDYDHSALRLLQIDVTAAVRVGDHLSLLGEVRTENTDTIEAYAAYVRIRPWSAHNFDIQVG